MQCRKCFYWPNMKKDFDQYVQECMLCLRNKDSTGKPIGDPKIPDIPLRPWESIAIDFLGPFSVSDGYQNIMVVMDRFSSAIILIPLRSKFTARDVANAFLTDVYSTHGLPSSRTPRSARHRATDVNLLSSKYQWPAGTSKSDDWADAAHIHQ
jgi:hypothetical protein